MAASSPVPLFAEYLYYGLLVYAMFGVAWGVSIPLVGAGGMALLAVFCIWRLRKSITSIYEPLALLLGCAVSFLTIVIVIHDESLLDNRSIVNWILAAIVIQSLNLQQKFLHRFALVALAIGVLLLPYLDLNYGGGQSERAGAEVGLQNPNALGAWFGFLSVYFVIVAIETKRNIVRIPSALVAAGCLLVVGLTVSRGALAGVAIAAVLALRRILKRDFWPVLVIAIVVSILFFSHIFDEAISHYENRGTEETGRFLVWPLVIERFFDAPLIGVGNLKVFTYVPAMSKDITPHNAFLYFALVSGMVPLIFFIAYWVKAISRSYHTDSPFQLPLVIYALIISLVGVEGFMYSWAMVSLCMAMTARAKRIILSIVAYVEQRKPAPILQR